MADRPSADNDAVRALRRRHEQELHDSDAHWRSIFDSAVDGIIVIDAHGIVERFNPSAQRLFGYTADEVVGRNVRLLMPSPHYEEHDQYLDRYHATGQRKIIGIGREVVGQRKDGTTFPLHLSVSEMNVAGGPKFAGILHDLTPRVQLEERLRDQTALARLGEMAAVIAHEVKNPLAGVRGAVEVIGKRLPSESRDRLVVKEILARIDGLNNMMTDLLLFARPPQPRPALVDVVPLIEMTASLISEDAALKDLRIDVGGAAPPVMADAELLKIVFHNLIVNGAHAMRGTGIINVSVKPVDRFCEIAVRDNGPGIPVDIRQKIFTPFFTTKSRGSGLGLPTAKRFVEAHHGLIAVDCPPSGGTTVTVQLPL
ncbi:MAG: PAS domain S-box protein [Acidobacteria bacterium]|nr:PAS domain S-box protein [Acidobacteriota bacterium]